MTNTPFQRDHPAGEDAARREVEANLVQLPGADTSTRLHLLVRTGDLLRTLGRLDQAELLLREALALAHQYGDRRAEAANRTRLATVVQYAGRQTEAVESF